MIKIILCIVIVIAFSIGSVTYSQPKTPKENIPFDIPSDVREEIEGLYSQDIEKRAKSATYLGEMGDRAIPAIPFLIEILDEHTWPSSSPGFEALKALARIGKPSVEPLIVILKDKHSKSTGRENAAEALGRIGDSRAVEPLIDSLENDFSKVRENAAWALGMIKDIRAIPSLIAALKDKGDESSLVRSASAQALGAIKDYQAVEPLIKALRDKDSAVRRRAALALGKISDNKAVEPLILNLKDKDVNVRIDTIDAIGMIKNPRGVEPLIEALNDENQVVRKGAVAALGNFKDMRVVEPLIEALKEKELRYLAASSLRDITGWKNYTQDYLKWQQWWKQNKENIKMNR